MKEIKKILNKRIDNIEIPLPKVHFSKRIKMGLGIFFILVILGVFIFHQWQKDQKINQICVKVVLKTGHRFFSSLDECIKVIKKAGGINKFKKLLEEIK